MKVLSLDIRNTGVEYGVFEKKFIHLKSLKRGFLKKGESLDELLKVIKADFKLHGAVVGLPFNRFSHQFVELPVMKKKNLRNAISFELEPLLPFPVEEYEFDYLLLRKREKSLLFLVLAIKRDYLMDVINILKQNGIGIMALRPSFILTISEFMKIYKGKNIFVVEDGEILFISGLDDSEIKFLSFQKIKDPGKVFAEPLFNDPGVQRYLLRSHNEESSSFSFKDYRVINYDAPLILMKSLRGNLLRNGTFMDFTPSEFRIPVRDYRPILSGILTGLSLSLFLVTDLAGLYKEKMAIERLRPLLESIKQEGKSLSEEDEQRRIIIDYINGRTNAILALSRLKKLMRGDTVLTGFTIDINNKIELEGNSSNSSEFFSILDSAGFFTGITYSGNIVVKDGREFFKVSMVMKR